MAAGFVCLDPSAELFNRRVKVDLSDCCHHRRGGRPGCAVGDLYQVLSAMGAPADFSASTSRPARCLRADAQPFASDFTIRTSLFTRSLSTCVWLYHCIQRMHVGVHSCMYACAHVMHTPLSHGVLMHVHYVPVLRMCVLVPLSTEGLLREQRGVGKRLEQRGMGKKLSCKTSSLQWPCPCQRRLPPQPRLSRPSRQRRRLSRW